MNFDHNRWDYFILAACLVIGFAGIVLFARSEEKPDDDDENMGDC